MILLLWKRRKVKMEKNLVIKTYSFSWSCCLLMLLLLLLLLLSLVLMLLLLLMVVLGLGLKLDQGEIDCLNNAARLEGSSMNDVMKVNKYLKSFNLIWNRESKAFQFCVTSSMEDSWSILLSDIWVNYHSGFSGASNDHYYCPNFSSINSKKVT